jgi:hypothetical protein
MIGHKLPNKTKSATVAEPKLFHQLNNPLNVFCEIRTSQLPSFAPTSSVLKFLHPKFALTPCPKIVNTLPMNIESMSRFIESVNYFGSNFHSLIMIRCLW